MNIVPRTGKLWQDLKAFGHIASTVRTHRVINAGTQLSFSFLFSLGPQPMEWDPYSVIYLI